MNRFYKLLFVYLSFNLAANSPAQSQCSLPGGSILITQASFGNLVSISSGQVYYVAPGTITEINHTSANLTVSNGGKIFVMSNATLIIQMGGKNMTINGGTVQLCGSGKLNISPGHDFTMQNGSLIQLGLNAHINMCNFGHDITFNGGHIEMYDFSSIEFGDFHNVKSTATDLVTFTGNASVGIASGDPIFHVGGSDFVHYANTSGVNTPLTTSSHIDFINDALGSDNPGAANYCGPNTSPTYATCRVQWGTLAVECGAAAIWQTYLTVHLINFGYFIEPNAVKLSWVIAGQEDLDHIEVERSVLFGSFELIAAVLPNSNGGISNNYTYRDTKPGLADTKYRLKLVSKDGKINYSSTLLVHVDNTRSFVVSGYPNPFTDNLNLSTNFPQRTPVDLELYNVSGIRVKALHITIPAGYTVSSVENLFSLPYGMYMMKISTNGENYYQQVIKK